jgi:hypothetical protein
LLRARRFWLSATVRCDLDAGLSKGSRGDTPVMHIVDGRATLRFPDGLFGVTNDFALPGSITHLPVALICRMPSACAVGQITTILSRILARQEGRYGQSSRSVGQDTVDASLPIDVRHVRGRRSRVVLAPRGPAPSWLSMLLASWPATVANGMVHRGEHV